MSYSKSKYNHRSEKTALIKILKMSIALKKKHGWSRATGSGFLMEDIRHIQISGRAPNYHNRKLTFLFHGGDKQDLTTLDLNLRETEEALKWVQQNL